ncbi:RNA polymerase sigma factor [Sorangium sp. So ce1000]|uniref:RNA polymerase sigma factor n=1 Tax=Sorangium sp. So ce1000 TaxID=3133325 RepID=UPI003F605CA8
MAEIADEHFSFIARYLARLGVRAQDIEDVAQEVLAGAYRALPRFDPSRGTVRSWLMGIATHQASNHFRRAHRRRERLRPFDDLAALPDATPDSEQHVIARDRRGVLDKLLQELPMERRCVFVAHELEEIDMAEIAQQLSIPLSTAWSRHRLAWVDIEAAMRRWQARQRGRGLALIPCSAGALVHEARAEGEDAPTLLARLCRGARGVFSPRRLPLAGGAPTRTGALHVAASVAVPLASAAAVIAITLGALRAASTPAAAGQRAATGLAMAVLGAPPPAAAAPPSTAAPAPSTAAPAPSTAALPPSTAALPPSTAAPAPSTAAPPPSTAAPPPSTAAPPPPSTAAPAPSTAAPPLPPHAAAAADAPQGGGIAGAGLSRASSAAPPARKAAPRLPGGATWRPARPSGASNDQEIAAERALIDGAITALSCGRYAEANSLLVEHRKRFPAGRLTAERNAAFRALRPKMAATTRDLL